MVLWIDEVEKGLAGGGGSNDTGVSARVFGTLRSPGCRKRRRRCSWSRPPTASSRCRPSCCARAASTRDLLRRSPVRGGAHRDHQDPARASQARPGEVPVAQLAKATEQFSGAELEQLVIAGLYDAFADGVELDGSILLDTVKTTPAGGHHGRRRGGCASGPAPGPAPSFELELLSFFASPGGRE